MVYSGNLKSATRRVGEVLLEPFGESLNDIPNVDDGRLVTLQVKVHYLKSQFPAINADHKLTNLRPLLSGSNEIWRQAGIRFSMDVPKSMPGIDLRDTEGLAKRGQVFGAAYDHDVFDVDKPNRSMKTRYIVRGDWKLLVPNAKVLPNAQVELYNLKADPRELADLASKQPDKVKALHAKLDAWWPGPTAN